MPIQTSAFWSGLLDLAGHVRPFRGHPAVCFPDARILRSLRAPLAFARFNFVFLHSGRHQLGPAQAFSFRSPLIRGKPIGSTLCEPAMAACSTQASQRPGLEAREHNPVLSLDRYSVWTACAPGRGQLSNSAQPEVTASGVPRYGAGSAGQSRSLACFFRAVVPISTSEPSRDAA